MKLKNDALFKIWLTALVLLIFVLLIYAGFYVDKQDHIIAILGISGIIITAMTSVLSINLNQDKIKKREIELLIVKEKQKVFEHFYNVYFELLKSAKKNKNISASSKIQSELFDFKRGLMSWGSEEVIEGFMSFEESLVSCSKMSTGEMLNVGDKFFKLLRKEMGFDDPGAINIMKIILATEARKNIDVDNEIQ